MGNIGFCLERAAGIEPATDGLEDRGSASELYPHDLAQSAGVEPARRCGWHQRKDLNPDERSWKPPCCRYITLVIGTRAGSRTPTGRSTTGRSAVELRERVCRGPSSAKASEGILLRTSRESCEARSAKQDGSEGRCRPCCGDLMRVARLLSPSPHRWQGVEPARAKPGLSFKGWPLTVRAHRHMIGAPWRFRPAFRALKERDPSQ
jgi:hypothetical protein